MNNLILFGFKGCGKTYFGRLLSKELGRVFIDTDHLVEELYKKRFQEKLSCREISLREGETVFRGLEGEVVQSLQVEDAIISLGGGTILDPANYERLKKMGKLIYLEADKEALKQRMLGGELPSFIDSSDPEGSFERMYRARISIYEKIDAIKIKT